MRPRAPRGGRSRTSRPTWRGARHRGRAGLRQVHPEPHRGGRPCDLGRHGDAGRKLTTKMPMIRRGPFASLDPRMKLGEIIAEGPRADGLASLEEMRDGVRAGFERVGLEPAGADRLPHRVSGGRLQRIAIARAMAMRPDLLVPDGAVGSVAKADKIRVAITAGSASRAAIHRSWKRSVRSPAISSAAGRSHRRLSPSRAGRCRRGARKPCACGSSSVRRRSRRCRSFGRSADGHGPLRSGDPPSVVAWDARVLVPAACVVATTSAGSAARLSSEIAGDVPVTCRARIGPAPRSPCATAGQSTGAAPRPVSAASTCRAASRSAAGEPGAPGPRPSRRPRRAPRAPRPRPCPERRAAGEAVLARPRARSPSSRPRAQSSRPASRDRGCPVGFAMAHRPRTASAARPPASKAPQPLGTVVTPWWLRWRRNGREGLPGAAAITATGARRGARAGWSRRPRARRRPRPSLGAPPSRGCRARGRAGRGGGARAGARPWPRSRPRASGRRRGRDRRCGRRWRAGRPARPGAARGRASPQVRLRRFASIRARVPAMTSA